MATTTYEHSTTTSSSGDIGLDRFYLRNWRGILKIAQCVSTCTKFACCYLRFKAVFVKSNDTFNCVRYICISAEYI